MDEAKFYQEEQYFRDKQNRKFGHTAAEEMKRLRDHLSDRAKIIDQRYWNLVEEVREKEAKLGHHAVAESWDRDQAHHERERLNKLVDDTGKYISKLGLGQPCRVLSLNNTLNPFVGAFNVQNLSPLSPFFETARGKTLIHLGAVGGFGAAATIAAGSVASAGAAIHTARANNGGNHTTVIVQNAPAPAAHRKRGLSRVPAL